MRHHFFLYYGWFLQNLRKYFIKTNMHTTVISLLFQAIACLTASVSSAPEPEASPQLFDPLQAVSPGNIGGNFGGNNFGNNFVDPRFTTQTISRPVSPLLDIRNPLHLIRNPLTDSRRSDELLLSSAYTSALR